MGHNALTRAIRHAEARDLVGRNVATLVDTPKGQAGRPSKSLTLEQASALLAVPRARGCTPTFLCAWPPGSARKKPGSCAGIMWTSAIPSAQPPVPASAAVWRSVRADGDTKTEKSRRTLGLPQMAVDALRAHKKRQERSGLAGGRTVERSRSRLRHPDRGALDAANVRREFKAACRAAKIGDALDAAGTAALLRVAHVQLGGAGRGDRAAGRALQHQDHEVVYRRELRPVLTTGAEAMDRLFRSSSGQPRGGRRRGK